MDKYLNQMTIYKEYDIRGIVPKEIDQKKAYEIGLATAKFLDSRTVIVGMDGRSSSEKLKTSLMEGITDYGTNVIDIGLVSTPVFYHAVIKLKKKGIMVTASHNPKEYNGFKISDEKAIPFVCETGICGIGKLVGKKMPKSRKKGKVEKKSILEDYIKYLERKFSKQNFKGINVVVDFSNGSGAVAEKIFKRLKIKHKLICNKIDGKFPCHGPNPMVEGATEKLGREVRKEKADMGIIFDGDADRVFFVDEKGKFIQTDHSFALLAKEALRKKKGKVYFDLRFSRVVSETIQEAGGTPVMLRVGNHFYKKALKKEGVIASEYSDHIMYNENYSIDDGVYASLKMISILASKKKKMSELIEPLKRYYDSGEINLKVKNKDKALERIAKKYSKNIEMFLDGVSVYTKDYWFNLRKSNTQPVIRLKIEATSKKVLNQMKTRLRREIAEAGK